MTAVPSKTFAAEAKDMIGTIAAALLIALERAVITRNHSRSWRDSWRTPVG